MYLGTDVFFRAGEYARGWATRKILYEISYFIMTLATLAILGWTQVFEQFLIAIIATIISLGWATVTIARASALSWKEARAILLGPLRKAEIIALWPFALNASLYIFYYRMTAVMLERLGSSSDVADFRVAFVVVLAALYLPKAVSWASSPRLALYDKQGDQERFKQLLRQSADINLLIACFVTLGGALYGARLIGIAFGHKYADMTALWALMNVTIGLFYVQQFCVDLLNYLKKEREVVRTFVLGIMVLVTLNFVLIPKFGAVGAAWARVAAGCLMMPINLYTLASLIGFENLHGMNLYRFAVVNVISGVIGFLLLQVNFWLSLGVFVLTYLALLFALNVIPENIRRSGGRFLRVISRSA
jgi:O-antigen/teichoic acid export membrane protein